MVLSSPDDHASEPGSSSGCARPGLRALPRPWAEKAIILAFGWLYRVSTRPFVDDDDGRSAVLATGAVMTRRGAGKDVLVDVSIMLLSSVESAVDKAKKRAYPRERPRESVIMSSGGSVA